MGLMGKPQTEKIPIKKKEGCQGEILTSAVLV